MSLKPLVLAVDDEPAILKLIKLELGSSGFRVVTAQNAEDALRVAEEQRPDIALLDVVMAGMNGLELMAELKDRKSIAVILLTAKEGEADKVRGLELGADDYLTKPFSGQELCARVRAVLRRVTGSSAVGNVVRVGSIEVDLAERVVTRNGKPITLSRIEWLVLQNLAAHAGKLMLNEELLSKVWGPEYREHTHYLRVLMSRLRKKIEEDAANPTLLKTFMGIGYMFDNGEGGEAVPEAASAAAAVG